MISRAKRPRLCQTIKDISLCVSGILYFQNFKPSCRKTFITTRKRKEGILRALYDPWHSISFLRNNIFNTVELIIIFCSLGMFSLDNGNKLSYQLPPNLLTNQIDSDESVRYFQQLPSYMSQVIMLSA